MKFTKRHSFYGLTKTETDLWYFVPTFLVYMVVYIVFVVKHGVLMILISFFCNYLATYLQYIQLRLNHLYIEEITTCKNMEKRVIRELKEICKIHCNAMQYVKTMHKIFSAIYLNKFVTATFMQCVLFFILGHVSTVLYVFICFNCIS